MYALIKLENVHSQGPSLSREQVKRRRLEVLKLYCLSRMRYEQMATALNSKDFFPGISVNDVRNDMRFMKGRARLRWRDKDHDLEERIEAYAVMHLESFNELIKEAFQASAKGKKVTTTRAREGQFLASLQAALPESAIEASFSDYEQENL